MAKAALDVEVAKKLQRIHLLDNVSWRRIDDIGADIFDEVVSDIKDSLVKISVQLNEFIDVSNDGQLIIFARYGKRNAIQEQFRFCKLLKTTTAARDIFKLVKSLFNSNDIPLQLDGSVCTVGASAILGNHYRFVALMKNEI